MNVDAFIYFLILICAVVFGLLNYSTLNSPSRLLTQLLGFVFIAEILNLVFAYTVGNNLMVSFFLSLIQLFYYFAVFSMLLRHKKLKKIYLSVFIGILSMVVFVTFTFYQFEGHPSSITGLIAIFVVFSVLLLFNQMLQNPNQRSLFKEFAFWFNLGNLVFFTFTFFIFITYDSFLNNHRTHPEWTRILTKASNYFLYSCYIYALICAKRQAKPAK